MKSIVYVYQHNELVNGHSIFDLRLMAALAKQLGGNFRAISFDNAAGEFKGDVQINEIDTAGAIVIFSHFNTFRAAPKFKKAKIIFINHDLPYHAYFLSKSFKNIMKGAYSRLYIKYYWRFSDFNFFISAAEQKTVASHKKNTATIKVGTRPGMDTGAFQSITPAAIFTGNYQWSLKKKSLYHTFKNGYTGNLKLIAVNADSAFDGLARQFNIPIIHEAADPYPAQIKIGVITDHFLSGFKLKALELIGMGCCIASFADIIDEFEGIRYAELFIRKINLLDEIDEYCDFLVIQENVIEKYNIFHNDIVANFNWEASAKYLLAIANDLQ